MSMYVPVFATMQIRPIWNDTPGAIRPAVSCLDRWSLSSGPGRPG